MPRITLLYTHPRTGKSVRFWVFLDRAARTGIQWSGSVELADGRRHELAGGFIKSTSARPASRDDMVAAACAEIAKLDLDSMVGE